MTAFRKRKIVEQNDEKTEYSELGSTGVCPLSSENFAGSLRIPQPEPFPFTFPHLAVLLADVWDRRPVACTGTGDSDGTGSCCGLS